MDLYNEDCFSAFKKVKDKTIDLFLLDLPYGQTACKWDSIIDLKEMWVEIKRTMKKDAVIVFFCTTKFGFKLFQANEKWFRYDLVWKKSRKVGFLSANKQPLRQHEMMYVFDNNNHTQFPKNGDYGTYNPQKTKGHKPYTEKAGKDKGIGKGGVYSKHVEHYGGDLKSKGKKNEGDRHPTSIVEAEPEHEMMYVFKEKGGTYNPQKTEGKPYTVKKEHLKDTHVGKYTELYGLDRTTSINKGDRHPTSIVEPKDLGEIQGGYYRGENGKPFKRMANDPTTSHPTSIVETVLDFKNPSKSVHKTQKPVDLCEWLIKSYSNEGDLVMDFCMGSGTTGVACKNTKRRFIGVEKDPEIFKLAEGRIN